MDFGVSRLLENGIVAKNIQEFSMTSLTNLRLYFMIPCSEFHKIHRKANHLRSHFSSLNSCRDYDMIY